VKALLLLLLVQQSVPRLVKVAGTVVTQPLAELGLVEMPIELEGMVLVGLLQVVAERLGTPAMVVRGEALQVLRVLAEVPVAEYRVRYISQAVVVVFGKVGDQVVVALG
jgi:hypothetical protein